MNDAELHTASQQGHDFANFAVQMSSILHVSAETIAISTAAMWTGFVPLLALGAYLYTKSHAVDIIPDACAIIHWFQTATPDELEKYIQSFPDKEDLEGLYNEFASSDSIPDPEKASNLLRCLGRLGAHIKMKFPPEELRKIKLQLLTSWAKEIKPDKVQKALTVTAILSSLIIIATKLIQIFAEVYPVLSATATALTYASPLLALAPILSAVYQVYKDHNSSIPQSAKVVNRIKLVTSIVSTTLLTISLFMPGLHVLFGGVLFFGTLLTILLGFIRCKILQKHFAESQKQAPDLLDAYNKWRNGTQAQQIDNAEIRQRILAARNRPQLAESSAT